MRPLQVLPPQVKVDLSKMAKMEHYPDVLDL